MQKSAYAFTYVEHVLYQYLKHLSQCLIILIYTYINIYLHACILYTYVSIYLYILISKFLYLYLDISYICINFTSYIYD